MRRCRRLFPINGGGRRRYAGSAQPDPPRSCRCPHRPTRWPYRTHDGRWASRRVRQRHQCRPMRYRNPARNTETPDVSDDPPDQGERGASRPPRARRDVASRVSLTSTWTGYVRPGAAGRSPDALGAMVGDGLAQVVSVGRAGGALVAVDVLRPGRPRDFDRLAALLAGADWFLPNCDQLCADRARRPRPSHQ